MEIDERAPRKKKYKKKNWKEWNFFSFLNDPRILRLSTSRRWPKEQLNHYLKPLTFTNYTSIEKLVNP